MPTRQTYKPFVFTRTCFEYLCEKQNDLETEALRIYDIFERRDCSPDDGLRWHGVRGHSIFPRRLVIKPKRCYSMHL